MDKAMWVLIAMWLWAVAAAGETLTIKSDVLESQNYSITVMPACNWDKNPEAVTVMGHYGTAGLDGVGVGVMPTRKSAVGNNLELVFDPSVDTFQGLPLNHLAVEVTTTSATCKQDFSFSQSNFTKKRR